MSANSTRNPSRDLPTFLHTGDENGTPVHTASSDHRATWAVAVSVTGTTAAPTLSSDGDSCENAQWGRLQWHSASGFNSATCVIYVYNAQGDEWSILYDENAAAVDFYLVNAKVPRGSQVVDLRGWDRWYRRYTAFSGTSVEESAKTF